MSTHLIVDDEDDVVVGGGVVVVGHQPCDWGGSGSWTSCPAPCPATATDVIHCDERRLWEEVKKERERGSRVMVWLYVLLHKIQGLDITLYYKVLHNYYKL